MTPRTPAARSRVLVAMSGGVDSSAAAALLAEQGHDLVGVTMHLWDAGPGEAVGRCCAPEDRDDARRTCDYLGIPHYVFDERDEFRRKVVDPFIAAYRSGETPSPCVHCNQQVKLGRLLEVADELGAEWIATGHYARIARTNGSTTLHRGHDQTKDQSYFLYGVSADVLSRMILPLGEMKKGQTREEARRLGVPGWDKPDSQELCFVPDGDVGGFIERETGVSRRGDIVDQGGEVLAEHDGIYRFTVGQRRGLGLGGAGKPRYVLRILPESQRVVVGEREALLSRSASATDVTWALDAAPSEPFDAAVQLRYRHRAARARITPEPGGFRAEFDDPQRAIAPGQAAVVYLRDRVIGGGILRA